MIRAFLFLLIVLGLAAAGAWFADEPGQVTLAWRDWRIDTSVALLVAAVGAIAVVAAILYRFWVVLVGAPARIGSAWTSSKRRRGYLALTRGMVAVAAGDEKEAAKQAGKAKGLLHDPPLTMLLEAQAAQLQGDDRAAEKYFTAMLEKPDMEFLGVRGLLGQALGRGDTARALELARRASALKPKSQWVADQLFKLETQIGDWTAAQATLTAAQRRHLVATDDGRRRRAVLARMESERFTQDGNAKDAVKAAKKAFDLAPDFAPVAAHYAGLLIAAGRNRRARSILEDAWARAPHVDLVAPYVGAAEAKDALGAMRALERLGKQNPDHAETHLTLARAALDAELWGEARRHLDAVLARDADAPTARVCRLMAALLTGEGGADAEARAWLERAAQAEADPAWVCGDCGNRLDAWAAVCARCGGFDTFAFGAAPHVTHGLIEGAAGTPGDPKTDLES